MYLELRVKETAPGAVGGRPIDLMLTDRALAKLTKADIRVRFRAQRHHGPRRESRCQAGRPRSRDAEAASGAGSITDLPSVAETGEQKGGDTVTGERIPPKNARLQVRACRPATRPRARPRPIRRNRDAAVRPRASSLRPPSAPLGSVRRECSRVPTQTGLPGRPSRSRSGRGVPPRREAVAVNRVRPPSPRGARA